MEGAGIFVALASEGLIVFPLSFLCERIQYNRQMGKHFKKPPPRMRGVSDTPCFAFRLTLVYPRAYGVDLGVVEVTYSYRGDYPRVCGVDLTAGHHAPASKGLSPHVRGR